MSIATVEFPRKGAGALPAGVLRKVQNGMRRDGAIAFENLFPMGLLSRIRREVLRRHESGELHKQGLIRDIGGRYAALLPFEGPFLERAFYANPRLQAMLGALLGSSYCIGSLETVISLPGSSPQHQHIDGPLRFERAIGKKKVPFRGDLSELPPYAVTLCVPLCDVDEENGPTAICPGSHRSALLPKPPSESQVLREFPVEHMVGKFGRSFFFDYRTFHCGMPNYTREPRPILMFVFTRSWFRDPNLVDVFPRVVISKRDLARVPERHRQLFLLAPSSRRPLWVRRAA